LGSVSSINTIDDSVNAPIAGATWNNPVWVVARIDAQRVFVLDKGAGSVVEINTSGTVDTIQGGISVGVGADYMVYDKNLNRLYVTNPGGGTVSVLDASDITGSISLVAVGGCTGGAFGGGFAGYDSLLRGGGDR
jgi:DNA-binding beta-propeller fold protein YncE